MSKRTIYHGSEIVIERPIYHYERSNPNNDYGLGFYCTQNLDMAKEWASRNSDLGYANKYLIDERGLKILDLTDKNKYSVLNWIAILIHFREIPSFDRIEYSDVLTYLEKYYIDVSLYDVVIGYRADDAYFRFPLMFIRNVLTYEKLEHLFCEDFFSLFSFSFLLIKLLLALLSLLLFDFLFSLLFLFSI